MASLPIRESRNKERSMFSDHERIVLGEQDLDKNDRQHAEMNGRLDTIIKLLAGCFVSTATGAIGLYLNLVWGTLK